MCAVEAGGAGGSLVGCGYPITWAAVCCGIRIRTCQRVIGDPVVTENRLTDPSSKPQKTLLPASSRHTEDTCGDRG